MPTVQDGDLWTNGVTQAAAQEGKGGLGYERDPQVQLSFRDNISFLKMTSLLSETYGLLH